MVDNDKDKNIFKSKKKVCVPLEKLKKQFTGFTEEEELKKYVSYFDLDEKANFFVFLCFRRRTCRKARRRNFPCRNFYKSNFLQQLQANSRRT